MNPADERDMQVLTSCPGCGQMASVAPSEALLPQICANCRQIHVANLNADHETDAESEAEVPQEVRDARYGCISRYRVTEILGRGAYGVVYKAWDPSLHRWVAIKVPMLAKDRRQRARNFLQEARTAAKLRHPLIVSVFDADQESGQPYIVSEYVEGETLASLLRAERLPREIAVQIVIELATALAHAHAAGVIHRDVKPSNIIIDQDGRPRLMDFGLAWQPDVASSTLEGPRAGTPGYMAPEQIRGQVDRISARTDQYSLGVILYESLAGQRLYEGPPEKVLRRILKEQAPPLRSVCPDAPVALEAVCQRMMATQPEARYPDLNAVAAELEGVLRPRVLESAPPEAATASAPEPPPPVIRRRSSSIVRIGLAAACLVIAMLGFGLTMLGRSQGQGTSVVGGPPAIDVPPETPAVSAAPDGEPSSSVAATTTPLPAVPAAQSTVAEPPLPAVMARTDAVATNSLTAPVPSSALSPSTEAPATPNKVTVSTVAVLLASEPAADALNALAEAEQQRLMAWLTPTYPPVLPAADDGARSAFRQEFLQLLDEAFPTVVPDDESRYRQLSARLLALQSRYPREPRIPFAMVLLKKLWKAPRNKANELLKEEIDLLLQARDAGGYEFTPASLAEIEYWITRDKPLPARDAMLRLVQNFRSSPEWPGEAERLRVVRWLGRVQGFYLSEISGLPTRDKVFIESQELLLSELTARERQAFWQAVEEIQTEVQDEVSKVEGKAQQPANLEATRQKMLQNLENQGDLASKLVTEQQENESLENWLTRMQESFRQKFQELEAKSRQIELTAGPISQRLATISTQAVQAANQLSQLQAGFANDPMTDPTLLRAAENQMKLLQQEATLLTQQLKALEVQHFELRRQSAVLSQQLQAVEGKYQKERKQDAQAIQKLKNDLKKLEGEGNTLVAQLKAPQKQVSRDKSQLRKITYWMPRYFDDGPRWLRDSLGPDAQGLDE